MAPSSTIRFPDLKNIDLATKTVILSALVQKLWSNTDFCIMVANMTCLHTSHVQNTQNVFYLLKGPDPTALVLKSGNILPINN